MSWLLAFHLIFVVTWFAALFYLPRLFVYHAECKDEISRQRFKIMERKLFNGIMLPSAILVLLTGGGLLIFYQHITHIHQYWLYLKLALVFLLYIYVGFCWKYLNDFKYDRNRYSHLFYRWFNEFPSVILILVVILAIVKPF